jgi:hypothetical protein
MEGGEARSAVKTVDCHGATAATAPTVSRLLPSARETMNNKKCELLQIHCAFLTRRTRYISKFGAITKIPGQLCRACRMRDADAGRCFPRPEKGPEFGALRALGKSWLAKLSSYAHPRLHVTSLLHVIVNAVGSNEQFEFASFSIYNSNHLQR